MCEWNKSLLVEFVSEFMSVLSHFQGSFLSEKFTIWTLFKLKRMK